MRRAIRTWLAVWAGWTALALFFAVSTSLTYWSTGRPANWTFTIERALSEWWLWVLLTPIIFRLAHRYPIAGARRWRHLLIHIVAGAAIAIVKVAVDRAILAWLAGFWMYWLASTLALQLFVYGAIVAAAHGVEYYRRSREREHLEARLAETRLQLLNLQLQPHFLFNTLNTIAELVHEQPDAADRMISGLSDLLRRALELGATQQIPLHAELDLLSLYLDIQKTRFGDRLQVEVDADADAASVQVPVMLLQPIVENAIRHGIAAHIGAGRIEIRARLDGARLRVTVVDDGAGVSDAEVREGVGLRNTRARLEALYRTDYRVDLTAAPNGGTQVVVELPVRHTGALA